MISVIHTPQNIFGVVGKFFRLSRNSTSRTKTPTEASGEALAVVEDSELLRRSVRGDDLAVRELLARHGNYLYGIARAMTGNAPDADDVVQETLLACLKASFRGESSVRTWMVKILVRQASLLRRNTKRRQEMTGPTGQALDVPTPSEIGSSDARMDLTDVLQTLSPEHRAVIVLRELEGLSYDEIAESLSLPRGTVESRLFRAREDLNRRFRSPDHST